MQSFLSSQYLNALGDYDCDVTSAVFQTDYDRHTLFVLAIIPACPSPDLLLSMALGAVVYT